jgi:hypothetical protein
MPLPVFTLSDVILTSKTPVETSVEVKVSVASHWSNLPSMEIDALTAKCMELPSGVILITGTSAGVCAGLWAKTRGKGEEPEGEEAS